MDTDNKTKLNAIVSRINRGVPSTFSGLDVDEFCLFLRGAGLDGYVDSARTNRVDGYIESLDDAALRTVLGMTWRDTKRFRQAVFSAKWLGTLEWPVKGILELDEVGVRAWLADLTGKSARGIVGIGGLELMHMNALDFHYLGLFDWPTCVKLAKHALMANSQYACVVLDRR